MSPREVRHHARVLEAIRRQVLAAMAMLVPNLDHADHRADGYRELAQAFQMLPMFAEACLAGSIGVEQMHAIATVAANPRVSHRLADADEIFIDAAVDRTFAEFITRLRQWETMTDADGGGSDATEPW